jgi:hypothetical protein
VPADWPGGVRHGGDVSPACGFRAERGKAHADTAVLLRALVAGAGGERERAQAA